MNCHYNCENTSGSSIITETLHGAPFFFRKFDIIIIDHFSVTVNK